MDVGHEVERSDVVDHAVRLGLVAYGLVHLVLGWIAVRLALGFDHGKTDTKGALHELTEQPFGKVLVWGVAVGMLLLVVWQLLELAVGHRDEDGASRVRERAFSLVKGAVYAVLGLSAMKIASGSVAEGPRSLTARLMDLPGGQALVVVVGLVIVGLGVAHVWSGVTGGFLEHLDAEGRAGDSGTAYHLLGRVGYVAKGVAFALGGGLVCSAGFTHQAEKSGGLDTALRDLMDESYGPAALVVFGVGIACYGVFCLVRARYLDR